MQDCSRIKFCLTPRSIILRGVIFLDTKIRIFRQKQNKNENILTLWSVVLEVRMMKKTGGRKFSWTVQLKYTIRIRTEVLCSTCTSLNCFVVQMYQQNG